MGGGIFEKWENDYLTRWQGNHQMEYKFVVVVLPFFFLPWERVLDYPEIIHPRNTFNDNIFSFFFG